MVTNLTTNANRVRHDKSSYDLKRPPMMDIDDDSDLGSPSELRIDPVLVKEVTRTYLPKVAGELDAADTELTGAMSLSPLLRLGDLGAGTYGPSTAYSDLFYVLHELIKNLQLEITYPVEALQLGVEDIGRQDTSAMDALERHARLVSRLEISKPGGTYDPWN